VAERGTGLILSADFGTTNLKAGLVDDRGRVLATASRPAKVMRPEPGAAEHDAEALWKDFCLITRKLARGRERRISAVATSAYQLAIMGTDEKLRPLTGMMTLLDTRPQSTYADMVRRIDHPRLYRERAFRSSPNTRWPSSTGCGAGTLRFSGGSVTGSTSRTT
jgi:gluconokinase